MFTDPELNEDILRLTWEMDLEDKHDPWIDFSWDWSTTAFTYRWTRTGSHSGQERTRVADILTSRNRYREPSSGIAGRLEGKIMAKGVKCHQKGSYEYINTRVPGITAKIVWVEIVSAL